ncbi:uncharacterized protein LOC129947433 [Eupeodes corollae]|uniref:uncharacterized protein LOC129943182 n=1 Tax=Eupeodes corollae TaxID=290404 RepID=UPI002492CE35|nr:uncharacterized protein LOC129943182 [Eupeodes corollae]XP_055913962.1 uncharacterized protein LOC129947433 [Eupeodes corollae]
MPTTNAKQMDLMVAFMESNPNIAKNYLPTSQAKSKAKNLWNNLAAKLNACGPPEKTTEGWKNVWKDYRYNLKRKMRDNLVHLSGTGGGPNKQKKLSDNEKTIISILDLNEAVSGNQLGKQFGDPNGNSPNIEVTAGSSTTVNILMEDADDQDYLITLIEDPQPQLENIENEEPQPNNSEGNPPSRNKKATKRNRNTLLEQHVDLQDKAVNMLNEKLETQKGILKELTTLNAWNKEADRRRRKLYDLKKEKLEEFKLNNIKKHNARLELISIKSRKLKLRQDKMEMNTKYYNPISKNDEHSSSSE